MDVALKATYNDGGNKDSIGFKGVCSRDIIVSNMSKVNCSSKDNPCRIFYDLGLKGVKPKRNDHCYESKLFIDWKFGAGVYHNGVKKGKPIPIVNVKPGDLAVVTTRLPDQDEPERIIVGIYKIAEVDSSNQRGMGTLLIADKDARLELSREIASQMKFWDYHIPNMGTGKEWHEGLFRYIDSGETDSILNALCKLLVDDHSKEILKILKQTSTVGSNTLPSGLDPTVKRVLQRRKYGPGGEGEEHRLLKEWIASHPEFLGLTGVSETQVEEHRFPSNDLPDIVFKLHDGWAAVEIETTDPLPGAFQAIKYKALLCAEQDLDIDDENVTSFLVAYDIPKDIENFCEKYKVKSYSKPINP